MKGSSLTLWEMTQFIGKKSKYGFNAGIAAAFVLGIFCCADFCLHSDAAIPLSMSYSIPETTQTQVIPVMQLEQDPVQTVPDLDAELVELLHQATVAQVEPIEEVTINDPAEQHQAKWMTVRMRVTGYCACSRCCGRFSDGRTANMHKIHEGDTFVAADKRIPFGTEMIIPGYNNGQSVEVKDRGRLIRGNRLDVFFSDHKVAKKWGVKYLDVLVKVEE